MGLNYASEFPTAAAAYEPAGSNLFLGLPPLMLALVIALLALAILIGWFLRAEYGPKAGDGADTIWTAIHEASLKALSAPTGELQARVGDLRDAIRRYLGDVLDLAKGVSGPFGDLEKALKGEVAQEPAKPSAPPVCGCGKGAGCGCGGTHGGGATAAAVSVSVSVAGGGGHGGCGCGADRDASKTCTCKTPEEPKPPAMVDKKPEPKPGVRPMTVEEQTAALAAAARKFHDHWSNKTDRLAELRRARRLLNDPPPAPKKSGGGMVWDKPGDGH